MDSNTGILTIEKFHELLHKGINKPVKDFRNKWSPVRKKRIKVYSNAHKASWAKATIFAERKTINIRVYLNFKKNNLSDSDYEKLKELACIGIKQYWSRNISISGNRYQVRVYAQHSTGNAIPVDLYIETDKNKYARSMNPALLGVDASFTYNKGAFQDDRANSDFKLVSAHEFGHSVLMYAGGLSLSWGHKGSTNSLLQSVKSSTSGYPKKGAIDLMKYYDWEKSRADFNRRMRDSIAMEVDVKRLIWSAKLQWIK